MERKHILGAFLNLLTGVGGHFYLGQPYRAVMFIIAASIMPFLVPWLYLIYSDMQMMSPELMRRNWAYASAAGLFLVFLISAIVTLLSRRQVNKGESTAIRRTAATVATLLLAAGAGMQLWGLKVVGSVEDASSEMEFSESTPPAHGKRFILGWGGDFVLSGSELTPGKALLQGRLVLDGKPFADTKIRLFRDTDNFTPWMTTKKDGGFIQPLAVGNYEFQALDIIPPDGMDLARYHIITGREAPLGDGAYGSWNTAPDGSLFVQLLVGDERKPFVIELVSMMTAERMDFSRMPSDEFAGQTLSWPRTEHAERYVLNIRWENGSNSNRLFYEEVEEPSLPISAIAGRGEKLSVQGDYFVDIYAFTANGKLVNHSSGEAAEQLKLPEGWVIRDQYQTPCEKRASEEAEAGSSLDDE